MQINSVNKIKQLHAYLVQNSLHEQNYWISLLLIHCSRLHAPLPYTSLIFASTTSPDASVLSSMLKYYSQLGAHNQVHSLFNKMQSLDIKPHGFVYPILIKLAPGKLPGTSFHAHIMKLGHGKDPFVKNAILGMYAKYDLIEIARKMFDEMPDRTLADWNSMISGYWKWGHESEALRMFDMMSQRNVVTWTAMVSGYAKIGDLDRAKGYFDEMPERSIVSWNAMLSGYSRNRCEEKALRLFHQMIDEGQVTPDETTWVTVISSCSSIGDASLADSTISTLHRKKINLNCYVKTALIDMYAKMGKIETAREIFDGLEVNKRSSVTWNVMISAYARAGDLMLAKELFDHMPDKSVISWNSMISGYAQNGESTMAIKLFKKVIAREDINPDEVTLVSVISACAHLGALELGNWAIKIFNEKNIKPSSNSLFNSMIYMYSKCGSMVDAERIFQKLSQKDVVSYNTLISGFASHGQGVEAIKLLSMMKQEGIEPDHITFINVLTSCSHAGLIREGWKIFESIKDPTVDHYACMVDLLGRAGELDQAQKLIQGMPMKPHGGVYGSLLNASRIHKEVKLGEQVADKLFELEPNNSGNYVLLSNIYAMAGRWEDVKRVREVMKREGVKKGTGWSWVEYKGEVHKFIVGDRRHERSKDIYVTLAELERKMRGAGYVPAKSCVLRDVEEEEKEEMAGTHSEKLAVCFGLLVSDRGGVIRVVKNLRICSDCHTAIKMISKLEGRDIIVRDNNRFHCFSEGLCSCKDYW